MNLGNYFRPKPTLAELEEEREVNEAEISVLQQRVLKKKLEQEGADLNNFKDEKGNVLWARVKNFLRK